jgi:hypothetical protein
MGNQFSSFGHTWFTKNYTYWNKLGEEVLNEGEVGHHATGCINEEVARCHDEDLEGEVFEENEPFPPNVMRPEESLIKKLGASMMVRCCNMCTMLIKWCGMLSFNECTHLLN